MELEFHMTFQGTAKTRIEFPFPLNGEGMERVFTKVKSVIYSVVSNSFCNPVSCSPPDSSVHGILQARTLEWVAIPFSRGSSRPRDQTRVSCIAGRPFLIWANRGALTSPKGTLIWESGCKSEGKGGHNAVPRGQLPEHRQHREGWGSNLAAGEGDWKILSTPVLLSLWVGMWLGYSVCDSEISSFISSVVKSVGDWGGSA